MQMYSAKASLTWPDGWVIPDWPAPAHVRAVMTGRQGGASAPPWHSFNLGDHVGDDPVSVAQNRAQLAACLGAQPVFLNQVHGQTVVVLAEPVRDGMVADACIAARPGVACTVMVADCLPLLFTNAQGRLVGAVHAGWRGLAGGVLEAFLSEFQRQADMRPEGRAMKNKAEIIAWLGPCIGPNRFEVGTEVRDVFEAQRPTDTYCFRSISNGKYLADLPELARARLRAMGVERVYGNNSTDDWCTATRSDVFFSHRRDGRSGRMAACIWLT